MSSARSRQAGVSCVVGGSPFSTCFCQATRSSFDLGCKVVRPAHAVAGGPAGNGAGRRAGLAAAEVVGQAARRTGRARPRSAGARGSGDRPLRQSRPAFRRSGPAARRRCLPKAARSAWRRRRWPESPAARRSALSRGSVSGSCREARQPKVSSSVTAVWAAGSERLGRSRSLLMLVNCQARVGRPRLIDDVSSRLLIDIDVHFLDVDFLAGRGEERIEHLLGRHPPPQRSGERGGPARRRRSARAGRPAN